MKKHLITIKSKKTNDILIQKLVVSPSKDILEYQKRSLLTNWIPLTIAQKNLAVEGVYVDSRPCK